MKGKDLTGQRIKISFLRPLCSLILITALSSMIFLSCFGGAHKHKDSYRIIRGNFWGDNSLHNVEKRIQGFSEDLLFTIASLYKVRFQIQNVNGIVSLNTLENPDVDAILSPLNPTSQLQREYIFSDPFFVEGPVIVSRFSDSYASLQDLKDRMVGVSRAYLWSLERSQAAQCIFQAYDDTSDLLEALLDEKVDAIIINSIIASQMAKGLYLNKIKVTSKPLITRGLRLVVKKGKSDELIADFNDGLKTLIEKGTYGRMLKYWELFNAQDPNAM